MRRRELEARVGSVHDLYGPRPMVVDAGPGRGSRVVVLRSAAGLEVTVNVDRGLDLRDAWWQGRPLAFASVAGDPAPSAFEPQGIGWLRSFAGGLMTTCGLRNVGPPEDNDGEHFGLHGRITAAAASDVEVRGDWEGDEFVSVVRGRVREARVAGEHLELTREIRLPLHGSRIEVRDVVRNNGFRPEPVLLLYHCNLGWPLVDEGGEVDVAGPDPVDMATGDPVQGWRRIDGPAAAADSVLVHEPKADGAGWATATVSSPSPSPMRLTVGWRPEQLPCLAQWRSFLAGDYTLAVEPGNCLPLGRAAALAAGRGDVLEPGAEKTVELWFEAA